MAVDGLDGARVLVTGASGFIGSHLCDGLIREQAIVHATSRTPPSRGGDIAWHEADLADPNAVDNLVRDAAPDVIFHLAGLVTGERGPELVLPTFRAIAQATVNLLSAALAHSRPRTILAGSLEELGPATNGVGSPYALAKAAASEYGRAAHALYGLPVVHLRLPMIYGPGQRDETKLVPYAIRSFTAGDTPTFTSGDRVLDWLYVDDAVDAFLAAAVAPEIEGLTIDIGTGRGVAIRDIVSTLAELTGAAQPAFGARPERANDIDWIANPERAGTLLAWSPKVMLEDGLTRTVAAYAGSA